jgi:hypothetical protein
VRARGPACTYSHDTHVLHTNAPIMHHLRNCGCSHMQTWLTACVSVMREWNATQTVWLPGQSAGGTDRTEGLRNRGGAAQWRQGAAAAAGHSRVCTWRPAQRHARGPGSTGQGVARQGAAAKAYTKAWPLGICCLGICCRCALPISELALSCGCMCEDGVGAYHVEHGAIVHIAHMCTSHVHYKA